MAIPTLGKMERFWSTLGVMMATTLRTMDIPTCGTRTHALRTAIPAQNIRSAFRVRIQRIAETADGVLSKVNVPCRRKSVLVIAGSHERACVYIVDIFTSGCETLNEAECGEQDSCAWCLASESCIFSESEGSGLAGCGIVLTFNSIFITL